MELKAKIVEEVRAHNFTAVCDGVTSAILPGIDDFEVPPVHDSPIGPHASGNYEVRNLNQIYINLTLIA